MSVIDRNYSILLKRLREKKPYIQMLLGPRQVGKTTTAERIFKAWEGTKLMVSADSPSPPPAEWIRFQWEQAELKGEGTLFIIDEVQKIPGWSEQIKILFDASRRKPFLKVLLLGSSSLYLQKGLEESLAGRFELIFAPHWSFSDFKECFAWSFEKYLRFGAYPGAAEFAEDPLRWKNYILNSIIEPVLGKDILGQNPVSKPALFRQTFELTCQYPAQVISLQKILGQLQDRGNVSTMKHYLDLLEKSFLVKCLEKWSGPPIQTRASIPKILVLNQALIHAYQSPDRLQHDPRWYGYVLENVVGAHLLSLPDTRMYYWREGPDEVDYVLKTPKNLRAIEIKSGLKSDETRGLQKFSKLYPKAVCEVWDLKKCVDFAASPHF